MYRCPCKQRPLCLPCYPCSCVLQELRRCDASGGCACEQALTSHAGAAHHAIVVPCAPSKAPCHCPASVARSWRMQRHACWLSSLHNKANLPWYGEAETAMCRHRPHSFRNPELAVLCISQGQRSVGGRAPSSSPPLAASAMTIQKNQVRLPGAYLCSSRSRAASVLSTPWPPAGLTASRSCFPGGAVAAPWLCQPASFSSSAWRQQAAGKGPHKRGWLGSAPSVWRLCCHKRAQRLGAMNTLLPDSSAYCRAAVPSVA